MIPNRAIFCAIIGVVFVICITACSDRREFVMAEQRMLGSEIVTAIWKLYDAHLVSIKRPDIARKIAAIRPDDIVLRKAKFGNVWIATLKERWVIEVDYTTSIVTLSGVPKLDREETPYRFIMIRVDMTRRVITQYMNVIPSEIN